MPADSKQPKKEKVDRRKYRRTPVRLEFGATSLGKLRFLRPRTRPRKRSR